MSNKTYTYKDLIEVYAETEKRQIHPDFERYYDDFLDALERAFEIALSKERIWHEDTPPRVQGLWMLFRSSILSYNNIHTPWDTFLENGAMFHRLKQWGDAGQQVVAYSGQISQLVKENKEIHMQMIEHIFGMMYGNVTKTVTSEDLRQLGFDDQTQPNIEDYYDYF